MQHSSSPADEATSRELAGGKVAAVWLEGKQCQFPAVLAGYDAVSGWIRQHGHKEIEPPREVWHRSPPQGA